MSCRNSVTDCHKSIRTRSDDIMIRRDHITQITSMSTLCDMITHIAEVHFTNSIYPFFMSFDQIILRIDTTFFDAFSYLKMQNLLSFLELLVAKCRHNYEDEHRECNVQRNRVNSGIEPAHAGRSDARPHGWNDGQNCESRLPLNPNWSPETKGSYVVCF